MKLVFIENNRIVTDSLTIAETFGKEHKHVLRDIREIECSDEFTQSNFGLSEYTDSTGRKLPKYLITQDGFTFLVMGYTGKEAARFKEMYINEFNRMRDELSKPKFAIPQTLSEALRFAADLSDQKLALEQKVEADKPLVLFAESLQVSKDSILVGEMAKLLKQNGIEIGGMRFFQWLRDEGYLIKKLGEQYNMPTQRSMELGIMEIKTGSRNGSDGTIKITRTPKITGKGQVYFINKFKGTPQVG
jgi:anti-repressor protein